jgi:hypothetical protein
MVTHIAIKKEKDGGNGAIRKLPLRTVAEQPVLENARKRLLDVLGVFDRAQVAKSSEHVPSYLVDEQKRMSRGMLSMATLPNAIILLSENPADPVAKRALKIVSEQGTTEEIKLAARILLERTTGA